VSQGGTLDDLMHLAAAQYFSNLLRQQHLETASMEQAQQGI